MTIGRTIQIGFVAAGWLALIIFAVVATLGMFVLDGFISKVTHAGQYTVMGFVVIGALVLVFRRQAALRWLLPMLPLLAVISGTLALSNGSGLSEVFFMTLILTPLMWALGLRLRQMWRRQFEAGPNVASWTIASAGMGIILWFLQTEGIDGLKDAWSNMVHLTYDPDFTGIAFSLIILAGCVAGLTYRPVSGRPPHGVETGEGGQA